MGRNAVKAKHGKRSRSDEGAAEEPALANLVALIAAEFAGVVRRKDGLGLHEADVVDSYGTAKDREAARKKDTETAWTDVPAATIERLSNSLPHLDPEGYAFYLPAYMTWALQNYRRSSSLSVNGTIYSLALEDHASLNNYMRARFALFTPAQSRAVLAFLRYMAHETGGHADSRVAAQAIELYWKKFGG